MAHFDAPADTSDYTRFGDVARDRCGMQCQYACHYLAGEHGSPNLAEGLRWYGNTRDYHNLMIHKDDAKNFVDRLRRFRIANHCGWSGEAMSRSLQDKPGTKTKTIQRTPAKIFFTKIQDVNLDSVVRMYVHIHGKKHTIEVSAENFTRALFGEAETPCELVEVIYAEEAE